MADAPRPQPVHLSRRQLFGGAAALGATAALGMAGCSDGHADEVVGDDVEAAPFGYVPPSQPPRSGIQRFLTKDEAQLLDALTAEILPGTPEDPGAREAGVVTFIDAMLADFADFDEPTYVQGPFVSKDSDADRLPDGAADLAGDELARYGFQGAMPPQETYRAGLRALDAYARSTVGTSFTAATDEQRHQLVTALADGTATGFDAPQADDFFDRVRADTIHAVFADPLYGGNRDMVGWRLIGYPGAQRVWTPEELQTGPNPTRGYQGLQELHHAHPGRPGPSGVIRPVQEPDPAVHG
jgi:gluconate 2-dehydrogenase gamma chain